MNHMSLVLGLENPHLDIMSLVSDTCVQWRTSEHSLRFAVVHGWGGNYKVYTYKNQKLEGNTQEFMKESDAIWFVNLKLKELFG